jgi:nucleotide-binding universal stress UspA family protein
MLEIHRILCPIDFSEHSRRSLQYAAATARWYGARLTVLHVLRYMPSFDLVPLLASDTTERIWLDDLQRQQLAEAADRFVKDVVGHGAEVDLEVRDAAQVHREIVARAEAIHADLVIMGTHGRSGYERLLLGSITEKVLRSAAAPVMVVPRQAGTAVPAGDVTFDRVLCAIDFSPVSVSALTYAMSLAEEADATLTLVNVIDVPEQPDADGGVVDVALAQARAAARADRLSRLRALVPESVRTYCRLDTTVEEGKPYREILRLAAEKESDLVVIGAQGHGPLGQMLFGSTANHVVRAAPCPVLAVPRRG